MHAVLLLRYFVPDVLQVLNSALLSDRAVSVKPTGLTPPPYEVQGPPRTMDRVVADEDGKKTDGRHERQWIGMRGLT